MSFSHSAVSYKAVSSASSMLRGAERPSDARVLDVLSEDIAMCLNHYVYWSSLTYQNFSHLAIRVKPVAAKSACEDSESDHSSRSEDDTRCGRSSNRRVRNAPLRLPRSRRHPLLRPQKSDFSLRPPRPDHLSTCGSCPSQLMGAQCTAHSRATSRQLNQRYSVPGWWLSDHEPLSSGERVWSIQRTFHFWSAMAARLSRGAIHSLIQKESLLWRGRLHPMLCSLSPEMARAYLESRLRAPADTRQEHQAVLQQTVEEMLLRSGTVVFDESTGEWEPQTSNKSLWDWHIILSMSTIVTCCALDALGSTPSMVAFIQAMCNYYALAPLRGAQQEARRRIRAYAAPGLASEMNFCYPGLVAVFLLQVAIVDFEHSPPAGRQRTKVGQLMSSVVESLQSSVLAHLELLGSRSTSSPGELSSALRGLSCLVGHLNTFCTPEGYV